MKRSWVYIDGVAYEKGDAPVQARTQIVPDFDQPYKSMITGEMITSRSKHKEHLRRHGYQEIGNDPGLTKQRKSFPEAAPQRRKELLVAQVQAMTHEQFNAARLKDLNRVRWQTNGIPDPLKDL
ncbi:MAG: hypothetical protein Q7J84_19000 [Sulfuricaulis sp.]|nr:hypothetical protein [Sulfuricaulis sp.]